VAFNYIEANHIDIFNSFVGGGIQFPKGFTEPGGGILSAYKGHFGQGSSAIPYSASLVSGPSGGPIPSPLSWNFLGLGVETGTRNLIGVDVKIGTDVSMGPIAARYSGLFNKITGKEATVTPADSSVSPKETHISALGNLFGNWFVDGTSFKSIIAHIAHSDARLKENIEPISSSTSLTKVLQLNPVYYKWRKDIVPSSFLKAYGEGKQIGLIAQEVEDIIPEVVKEGTLYDKQWKGINYSKLTAMLIGAVKEQQEQIEELKNRITELES
tara:strand:+ start:688 stop:1497 length:810 start_codon:yes stop_codon:yes gene_type:complete